MKTRYKTFTVKVTGDNAILRKGTIAVVREEGDYFLVLKSNGHPIRTMTLWLRPEECVQR